METEDLIKLPKSSNSAHGIEIDGARESLPLNSEVIDDINGEAPTPGATSDVLDENMDALMEDDFEKGSDSVTLPAGFEMTNSVAVIEKVVSAGSVHAENGTLSVQSEITFGNLNKNGTPCSRREINANSLSGVKRPRLAVDEQQPSVHVIYSFLPRESKQKLEKLLEQWSQWHSLQYPSSDDSNVVLESGEETYFPALNVGGDKPSSITFWMDNQTKMQSNMEFKQLDSTSVPLYDRGFSLVLTSSDGSSGLDGGAEKLNTSRCFNCGSYSHALKDCTKPRDNVAVNNARKQQNFKRNNHANARNSTRYYQSSRRGKYDDLTPGVLNGETRKALGLKELDPPPWLNRMREIGYPPGYLGTDTEDMPSGITIFGDESCKDENEGKISGASKVEPSQKMTVKFPGINAPIPENADERLWTPNDSKSTLSGYSSHQDNQASENPSRGHHSEQRWFRDLDDEGPPRCERGTSPPSSYHFRKYGDVDSGYHHPLSPRSSLSTPLSSSYGRSLLDRGRRSDEGTPGCEPGTSPSLSYHFRRYGGVDSGYNPVSPRASLWTPLSSSYGRSLLDRGRRSDEGHPDCELGTSPSLSYHFRRYGDVDSVHHPVSPRDSPSTPWNSSYGRSLSDRGRRTPLIFDGSTNYGS